MAGRKRQAQTTHRRTRGGAAETGQPASIPNVVTELLDEAGVTSHRQSPERPLKKRRAGPRPKPSGSESSRKFKPSELVPSVANDENDSEEGIEFEDVVIPEPTLQTINRDSEEDSEDESDDEDDNVFEDIDLSAAAADLSSSSSSMPQPQGLELNLTEQKEMSTPSRRRGPKRKPISKEERARRVEVHRMHLLALLAHVSTRNEWCNDAIVQSRLGALLTQRNTKYLNPGINLSQFGRSESLKTGLKELGPFFKTKFQITERGMRRPLWAEDPDHLSQYELPPDLESCHDKSDFRDAAKSMQGSRDVGAQLYCALLRAAGVQARLVCSLQPLAFNAAGPALPKPRESRTPVKRGTTAQQNIDSPKQGEASSLRPQPVHRAMHPAVAAHYRRSSGSASSRSSAPPPTSKRIRESPFPIYWVEVLDVAHQKWRPADPLVTRTFWKQAMEPPLTDKENSMAYVVAFDEDGTARDVTRRYAKAYMAKTRKLRVETVMEGGDRWWRRALRHFSRGYKTDLDQIEDNELAAIETREPMPRNIADFKNHPLYVLERHLKRNEVLVPTAKDVGTAAAGPTAPLERIYLRRDVKMARSQDKWYRMGRTVKFNEIPAKFLPPKKGRGGADQDEEEESTLDQVPLDTPLYTLDQTDEFKHPPVVDGKVPKNRFGNLDVYVPSMVPEGGVHINHELAARAAFLCSVDYAPALTGFDFKGRHGTAVLRGVVVATEYEEAVRAVIQGLIGLESEMEQERRSRAALRQWRRFLTSLRIRQEIWKDVDVEKESAEAAAGTTNVNVTEAYGAPIEVMYDEEDEDDGADFIDDDDYGGGGFIID